MLEDEEVSITEDSKKKSDYFFKARIRKSDFKIKGKKKDPMEDYIKEELNELKKNK